MPLTNPSPYGWRITKYNPARRNAQGLYPTDDWTSFSDIGRKYGGRELTYDEYFRVETAYVMAAQTFLRAAGLNSLRVSYLENASVSQATPKKLRDISFSPAQIKLHDEVSVDELKDLSRLVLREVLWCKLEANAPFYLHFGWDYYMYIGSTVPSSPSIRAAQESGLFVEEMASPYLQTWE